MELRPGPGPGTRRSAPWAKSPEKPRNPAPSPLVSTIRKFILIKLLLIVILRIIRIRLRRILIMVVVIIVKQES